VGKEVKSDFELAEGRDEESVAEEEVGDVEGEEGRLGGELSDIKIIC
jgi:hypothetical protein